MIKHIDTWFAWARQLGLGIGKMEDIILVTGADRTRSWTNVAFPGGPEDGHISFGANVTPSGDSVAINWTFSHERNRGAVLNRGPNGEVRQHSRFLGQSMLRYFRSLQDLLEDQCIFLRGYRVSRKFVILPRGLKAAAGPNPDPKGDDNEPSVELMSIPAVPEVNYSFWNFLVFSLPFEVPRSSSFTIGIYHRGEYHGKEVSPFSLRVWY